MEALFNQTKSTSLTSTMVSQVPGEEVRSNIQTLNNTKYTELPVAQILLDLLSLGSPQALLKHFFSRIHSTELKGLIIKSTI